MLAERGDEAGENHQCYQEGNHAGTYAQGDARLLLKTKSGDDRVGNQGIGSHDAAQQQGSLLGVMQKMDTHAIGQDERDEAGEQAIDEQSPLVFLHALHVHLQGGKEHNVIKSHLAEQLKR